MPAPRKYPEELRERAVRLVLEAREQDAKLSLNAAVLRIGPRVGVNKDTLRGGASRPRSTRVAGRARRRRRQRRSASCEQEVKELKRANEILLAASSFFAWELDPRLPW